MLLSRIPNLDHCLRDGFLLCWIRPLHPGATLHPAAGLSAKSNITTRLNTAFPKALSPWVPPENKRHEGTNRSCRGTSNRIFLSFKRH